MNFKVYIIALFSLSACVSTKKEVESTEIINNESFRVSETVFCGETIFTGGKINDEVVLASKKITKLNTPSDILYRTKKYNDIFYLHEYDSSLLALANAEAGGESKLLFVNKKNGYLYSDTLGFIVRAISCSSNKCVVLHKNEQKTSLSFSTIDCDNYKEVSLDKIPKFKSINSVSYERMFLLNDDFIYFVGSLDSFSPKDWKIFTYDISKQKLHSSPLPFTFKEGELIRIKLINDIPSLIFWDFKEIKIIDLTSNNKEVIKIPFSKNINNHYLIKDVDVLKNEVFINSVRADRATNIYDLYVYNLKNKSLTKEYSSNKINSFKRINGDLYMIEKNKYLTILR